MFQAFTEYRSGRSSEDSLLAALCVAVYNGFGALFGTGGHEAQGLGSKLLNMALGILIFYTAAVYTANLASILFVQKVSSTKLEGMDDVLRLKLKLCVKPSHLIILRSTYSIP